MELLNATTIIFQKSVQKSDACACKIQTALSQKWQGPEREVGRSTETSCATLISFPSPASTIFLELKILSHDKVDLEACVAKRITRQITTASDMPLYIPQTPEMERPEILPANGHP